MYINQSLRRVCYRYRYRHAARSTLPDAARAILFRRFRYRIRHASMPHSAQRLHSVRMTFRLSHADTRQHIVVTCAPHARCRARASRDSKSDATRTLAAGAVVTDAPPPRRPPSSAVGASTYHGALSGPRRTRRAHCARPSLRTRGALRTCGRLRPAPTQISSAGCPP